MSSDSSVEWKFKQALRRAPTPGSGTAGVLQDALVLLAKEIDATNKRLDQLEQDRSAS